jgi:hypothetical protein
MVGEGMARKRRRRRPAGAETTTRAGEAPARGCRRPADVVARWRRRGAAEAARLGLAEAGGER